MSQPPRFYELNPPSTVVDDADATIQYNGTWNAANDYEIQLATFVDRTPLFNTLHVLQVFDGSFSYNFTGGGISVFATPVDNSTYTLKCFLDGNQLSSNANATRAQFGQSQPVCQAFGLPDNAVHTISVFVSVPPRDQQDNNGALSGFAFDYMLIQPPSGPFLWDEGTEDVFLPVLDTSNIINRSSMNYSGMTIGDVLTGTRIANFSLGWEFDHENGFRTTTPESRFDFTFTGISLWWYGFLHPWNQPLVSSPFPTFSVDGGALSIFAVPLPAAEFSSSQVLFFKTPVLRYATHTLTVAYYGTNVTPPLTLQSILIQKSIPTLSVSVPNSTVVTPPPNFDAPPLSTKRGNLRSIIGGVSGGVVLLLLLAFGVCILIRWTRKTRHFAPTGAHGTTVVPEPFPPPTNENSPIRLPRKAQAGHEDIGNPFMQQALQEPPLTKWTRHRTIFNNPADSQSRPAFTNIVNDNSAAGQGDTQSAATPNIGIPTRVETLRGTDEVDGRSDRPPLYTAQ